MSTNIKPQLSKEQLSIIDSFRENTHKSILKLIEDLGKSGLENPSLTVLGEVSAFVGDVVYLMEKYTTQETLILNKCPTVEEFSELLLNYAVISMSNVIKDYRLVEKMTNEILDYQMQMGKNVVKH